jgi:hypothetical protein
MMCEGVDQTDLFQEIFWLRAVLNVLVKVVSARKTTIDYSVEWMLDLNTGSDS